MVESFPMLLRQRETMKGVAAAVSLAWLFCAPSSHALEALPAGAMEDQPGFRIEVLQVADIEPFQQSLDGFMKALQDNGIAPGKNLSVRRTKIDFDLETGGFWDRVGVLLRIRSEALRIAREKLDLVLTIGTPPTKYARSILDDAQIPVVFTAVANPLDAGCASLSDAGPGATGGLRNYEPAKDLGDFGVEYQLPVVSFAMVRVPGALLYIGADFASVGGLSGLQAMKIHKRHTRPDISAER